MQKEEETIGKRIAAIRGDLKQVEFANRIGVGRTTVIRYEADTTSPDANFLRRLVEIFGVDPVWLLMGGNEPPQKDMSTDEKLLLERYRAAPQAGKDAILGAALGQKPASAFKQNFEGGIGQYIETIPGDGLSFNVTVGGSAKPAKPKK